MSKHRRPISLHLTLTEPALPFGNGAADVRDVTTEGIRAMVNDFYARCRAHAVLGPIFERHVADWEPHVARICAFWNSALLKTGEYAGRPLEAHKTIPDLAPEHFSMWLRLFADTVRQHFTPRDSAVVLDLAGRMARAMMNVCGLTGAGRTAPLDP